MLGSTGRARRACPASSSIVRRAKSRNAGTVIHRAFASRLLDVDEIDGAGSGRSSESSLVVHYVTKVWSDVRPGLARATSARRRSNSYILDHTLTERPEQRHGPGARRRAGRPHSGPTIWAVRRKSGRPAVAAAELTRPDPEIADARNPEKCSNIKILLRTPAAHPYKFAAVREAQIFRFTQRPARTPQTERTVNRGRTILPAAIENVYAAIDQIAQTTLPNGPW